MRPAQFFLRAPLGAAHLGFAQFPFHRWHQPRQALFHHVIVGSGPHGGHGRRFIDMTRNDNERHIRAALLDQV